MSRNLKLIPELIVIPEREVVKLGDRWIVYLPQQYSALWRELKERKKKVRIYIEVIENG